MQRNAMSTSTQLQRLGDAEAASFSSQASSPNACAPRLPFVASVSPFGRRGDVEQNLLAVEFKSILRDGRARHSNLITNSAVLLRRTQSFGVGGEALHFRGADQSLRNTAPAALRGSARSVVSDLTRSMADLRRAFTPTKAGVDYAHSSPPSVEAQVDWRSQHATSDPLAAFSSHARRFKVKRDQDDHASRLTQSYTTLGAADRPPHRHRFVSEAIEVPPPPHRASRARELHFTKHTPHSRHQPLGSSEVALSLASISPTLPVS